MFQALYAALHSQEPIRFYSPAAYLSTSNSSAIHSDLLSITNSLRLPDQVPYYNSIARAADVQNNVHFQIGILKRFF